MELIYHEKQEGSLCAVHCLNALLQGSYFSAVDLAELATHMDNAEQQHITDQDTNTGDYLNFVRDGSNNMDDSGMFSIQVVTAALHVWDLILTPFTSTGAASACRARDDPTSGSAYICNMREHWFTIRKLGLQWFNLNSLLAFPELLSNTYLALFLAQLQNQGYDIYLVEGRLPQCPADAQLSLHTVTQAVKPPLLSELSAQSGSRPNTTSSNSGNANQEEDDDLAAALAASLADSSSQGQAAMGSTLHTANQTGNTLRESVDTDLERALQLSLTEHLVAVPNAPNRTEAATPDDETLRQKRLQFFDKKPRDQS